MGLLITIMRDIEIMKDIIYRQEQLFKKVKKLEQVKTYYPMTENKIKNIKIGGTD